MERVFISFDEVAKYMEEPIKRLGISKRKGLREIGKYLRKTIRDKHGQYGPGWLQSKSSPNTPLLRTGELRRSVSFRTTANDVEIYSRKEWLAEVHEYGVTYKMSDKQRRYLMGVVFKNKKSPAGRPRKNWGKGLVTIPARPIWRIILAQRRRNLEDIVDKSLQNIF